MSAQHIVGFGGGVTLPTGFAADLDSWSATVNQETTVFSTFASRWKNSKLLSANVTGSCTGMVQFDAADTMPVPDAAGAIDPSGFSGSMTLTATTGCTLTGTFNFTKVTLNRPHDGKMEFSADFESDGAVSITWDETP